MARTSIATDNFNRASLGTSDWTQMNTALAGDIQIDSSVQIKGQYQTQATDQKAAARWVGSGSFTDDQYSSLKLVGGVFSGANATMGVCVRASGAGGTRTYYELFIEATFTPNTVLSKWVNGTRTVLATSTGTTWATNDEISLEVEGTTLRACQNGTPIGGAFTTTDSSISTGKPGVVASTGVLGDDWEGGNITAPVSTLSGDGALDVFTASGTLSPAGTSTVSGDGALDVFAAGGGIVGAVGTIVTPPLKNNTGTLLASVTGVVANVYNSTTGALVVRKTGLVSDMDGTVTIADTSIAVGTTYAYEIDLSAASLGRRLPTKVAT